MTRNTTFLILFTISLFCAQSVFGAKGLKFSLEKTVVLVNSIDSYQTSNYFEGSNETDAQQRFYFSVIETEKLVSKQASVIIEGKAKKINIESNFTVSTINWGSVFNGIRTYSITLPPRCIFKIEYQTSAQETIFLSDIDKSGVHKADDFFYEVTLPANLEASFRHRAEKKSGRFVITNQDFQANEERIYFLIHPKGAEPNTYFNNWFIKKTEGHEALNTSLLPQNLTDLAKKGKSTELAKACFAYVQDNIQYLDIENGLNALIPRQANQTIVNKYGDCKDMAMLLHQLLKTFGFESYMSISKTSAKKDTYDFPSIAMANHMIVSLVWENKMYFLDCTEQECLFGDPSMQILGTEAFLVGKKEQQYQPVPAVLQFQPKLSFEYRFYLNDKTRQPAYQLKMTFQEKFGLVFRHMNQYGNAAEKTAKILDYLIPYAHTIDSSQSTEHQTSFLISSDLPSSYFNVINNQYYVDLKCLPEITKMMEVAYNNDSARFNADFQITFKQLKFKQTFDPSKGIDLETNGTENKYTLHLTPENSGNKGLLTSYWKTYLIKPAIILE